KKPAWRTDDAPPANALLARTGSTKTGVYFSRAYCCVGPPAVNGPFPVVLPVNLLLTYEWIVPPPPPKFSPTALLKMFTFEQITSDAPGPELTPCPLCVETELSMFMIVVPCASSAKKPAPLLPAATELLTVTRAPLSATIPALPLPSART